MMFRWRVVSVLAVVSLHTCLGVARADETTSIADETVAAITRDIETEAEISGHYGQCPADLFEVAKPLWRSWIPAPETDVASCGADLVLCKADCLVRRNENACFALGRVLQEGEDAGLAPRYAQMMFSQACATGSAGGCTNRAASIRNARPTDDPFETLEPAERDACLFRSFATACAAEDAWGCAMEGQSHQYGEGTKIDLAGAKRAYEASCAINASFSACDYIRPQLERLK